MTIEQISGGCTVGWLKGGQIYAQMEGLDPHCYNLSHPRLQSWTAHFVHPWDFLLAALSNVCRGVPALAFAGQSVLDTLGLPVYALQARLKGNKFQSCIDSELLFSLWHQVSGGDWRQRRQANARGCLGT